MLHLRAEIRQSCAGVTSKCSRALPKKHTLAHNRSIPLESTQSSAVVPWGEAPLIARRIAANIAKLPELLSR
jgi:hypothetical protein